MQAVSLTRAVGSLLFVIFALAPEKESIAFAVFLYASLSDVFDGLLARLLHATTTGGAALDIACDKYLTIYSLLFLIAVDSPMLPVCLALARDIFVQAFRAVDIDGEPLFAPVRTLGVLVVIPIRFTTGFALLMRIAGVWLPGTLALLCWICGTASCAVLAFTLINHWRRFVRAFLD